jgi:O-antigen/teichoic acid export membrane protein
MLWWAAQDQLNGVASISAIAIGSLAALIPGIWQTRREWSFRGLDLRETWKKNWKFGKWILGSSTSSWLAVEFYPVLTAGIVNFAAAGAYRALQNLVAPILVLIRASDTYITPRAAKIYDRSGVSGLTRLLRTTYSILIIPVAGMLVVSLLFPEQLLYLLYGETYLPYSRGAALMILFYALLFAYTPAQTALKAVRISKPLFYAYIGAIISMFTIGVLLIQKWGVYGTMAGQVLNSLIIFGILWSSWVIVRRAL